MADYHRSFCAECYGNEADLGDSRKRGWHLHEDGVCMGCTSPSKSRLQKAFKEVNGYLNKPREDFFKHASEIARMQYGN